MVTFPFGALGVLVSEGFAPGKRACRNRSVQASTRGLKASDHEMHPVLNRGRPKKSCRKMWR